ncbi:hypothetical protein [Paraferrimonas sedimenticola]|uniref:Lipoprotein n=1 Tax=Paraferrimonas sedimenticola TaxID=375674 RepID=A0AA37RUM9_9GAMM|nr:hypothetical protein [Paraferrimonas sedimenticola]GLP95671.1 hypothetical protein GCM10007895_09770 [Paraferrimonas sedimenticola]
MADKLVPLILLTFALFLGGCGDDRPEKIAHYQAQSAQRIEKLGQMLDNGEIRNAMMLNQYADVLSQTRPELSPLLNQLKTDASRNGPLFQQLQTRLADLSNSANFLDLDEQLDEAYQLTQAADPNSYNDLLSDPLNVIADMSNGELARVNAVSQAASLAANGAEDFGAGSQLVGNPAYGSWQTNSSGMSFWEWYGMYALFSNLTSPVRYDRWSRNRDYSYYGDYGRKRYTSPKTVRNEQKTFSRDGRFSSPYAKTNKGSAGLSKSSQVAQQTKNRPAGAKFRSNYSKSSGGFRSSSNRTARSTRRGK